MKSVYKYPDNSVEDFPSESTLMWAKDLVMLEGEEIESLWGNYLFPESIHLFSGDTGVGKTTFLYNLAIKGATGESFLDTPFSRPLRVLYLDYETSNPLKILKLNRITSGDRPENLAFDSIDFTSNKNLDTLIKITQENGFDLVIVDTINEAFRTQKEDDNAEANRQMDKVRQLVKETGASVILVHHMGKRAQEKGIHKPRGATARPASVDVALNFESLTEDIIKLTIAKNRWMGGKEQLFLEKAGSDHFEITE